MIKVSCGCNKTNRTLKAKNKNKNITTRRPTITPQQKKDKAKRKKLIEKKLKFCRACIQSTQTHEERRRKTKVCHKTNTSIQAILNKQNFKCPLGNF